MKHYNALTACLYLAENPPTPLEDSAQGANRINNVGEALEEFVKGCFAEALGVNSHLRESRLQEVFSYLGSPNHPPDSMLRNGDAIEVKKLTGNPPQIALNSSFPKKTLLATDPKITAECQACEEWTEKNLLYVVGNTADGHLRKLWIISGDCYAASSKEYEKVANAISSGVNAIPGITLSETKELARINKVDPLGATALRVRGMWTIQSPSKLFAEVFPSDPEASFELFTLISEERYLQYPASSRGLLERSPLLSVKQVTVPSPDNPEETLLARRIIFTS